MTMMNLYDLAREYADVYGSGVSAAELIEYDHEAGLPVYIDTRFRCVTVIRGDEVVSTSFNAALCAEVNELLSDKATM